MDLYLLIAAGSALGGVTRFWLSGVIDGRTGGTFPWGTLAVNVTGSFLIGYYATLAGTGGRFGRPEVRQFFMTGFCGGYTTFSAFSLQTMALAREGEWLKAGANVLISVALNLAAVAAGHVAARSIHQG